MIKRAFALDDDVNPIVSHAFLAIAIRDDLVIGVTSFSAIMATGRIAGSHFLRRLKRTPFWRCCGPDNVYNPRTQICCGSNVYDR